MPINAAQKPNQICLPYVVKKKNIQVLNQQKIDFVFDKNEEPS
jgi:hypothetical protein